MASVLGPRKGRGVRVRARAVRTRVVTGDVAGVGLYRTGQKQFRFAFIRTGRLLLLDPLLSVLEVVINLLQNWQNPSLPHPQPVTSWTRVSGSGRECP